MLTFPLLDVKKMLIFKNVQKRLKMGLLYLKTSIKYFLVDFRAMLKININMMLT